MALGRILGATADERHCCVLAPLRVEAAHCRPSRRGRVLRTGMGPARARIAAARGLAVERPPSRSPGVCGGVAPELRAGDVVCATELRRDGGEPIAVPAQRVARGGAPAPRPARAHRADALACDASSGPAERRALAARRRARGRHGVGLARRRRRRPAARRRARRRWTPRTAALARPADARRVASWRCATLRRAAAALVEWTQAEAAECRTRPDVEPASADGGRREHPAAPERRRRALPHEAARAGNEKFPLLVELEPLFQCNLACSCCGKIQYPEHILQEADAGAAGARRDRGVGRADGLDRRRRAARAPRDARDGRGADQAQEVRLPLHERDPDAEEDRPLRAVAVLRLGRPPRRDARAARRSSSSARACSTRRSRRSRRRRSAASA